MKMALSKQDALVLDEVVNLDGKCMDSVRCPKCPFRAMCLPEFLNPVPPTAQQRAKMALDVLMHHALVDETLTEDDIKKDFRWDKK